MSTSSNGFIGGSVQLILNGTNSKLTGDALDFTNRCFAFYFQASQNIKKCPDAKHKEQMNTALWSCAAFNGEWSDIASWGAMAVGNPNSLMSCAERFKKDGKNWKFSGTGVYYSKESSPIWSTSDSSNVSDVPLGPKHFADKVNEKFASLLELVKEHKSTAAAIVDAIKKGKKNNLADDVTAQTVSGDIDKIIDYAEKAKPLLWLAHPTIEDKVLEASQGPLDFAGTLSKAIQYADVLNKQTAVSINGKSLTLSGLQIVASLIPVFGEFYASAIELIPAATNWAHDIVRDEVKMLAPVLGKQAGEIYPGWQAFQ
ncbi:MAG: hypothetical protein IT186_04375 [Acidobacteria bacterium]|nr:hypothetical protein [Acidobacteriota bacterium]MCK6682135.1 hypothetical protein [Thermoanaerobaculia bacterium]